MKNLKNNFSSKKNTCCTKTLEFSGLVEEFKTKPLLLNIINIDQQKFREA